MDNFIIAISLLLVWIVLNRFVLPWFGIPTCMSGGCGTSCRTSRPTPDSKPVEPQGDTK